jgi:flavin reductase (DIM6/NTAB) family NADH-FMN oxidoreductase RutF
VPVLVFDPAEHDPGENQGMLSQLIVPRPIAMVSTLSPNGQPNLSPFSYFLPLTGDPPLVGIAFGLRESDGALKHSYLNLRASGEFVINVCSDWYATDHIETVAREYPADVDEFAVVGWHTVASVKVGVPGVAEAPARLECRVTNEFALGGDAAPVALVVAEVVAIVLDEKIVQGDDPKRPRIDGIALGAIGRSGSRTFVRCIPEAIYHQERPPFPEANSPFVTPL